jgi:hypothetical protein
MAKPPGAPKVVAPARASKARLAHGGHALLQCNNLPHGAALLDPRHTSIGATPRSPQRRASAWETVWAKAIPPVGPMGGSAAERASAPAWRFARTDSQGRMDLAAT